MGLSEQFSGDIRTAEKSEEAFPRMPILWIFVPQVFAYTLCLFGFVLPKNVFPISCGIAFSSGLIALTAALIAKFWKMPTAGDIWKIFLPIAVFFLAGTWWSSRAPITADWHDNPETEAVIELKIESLFRSRGKSWTGIAIAENNPVAGVNLEGTRVYFQFAKKEFGETPFEGMRFKMRGILKGVAKDSFFDGSFREFLMASNVGVAATRGDSIEEIPPGIVGRFEAWCVEQKRLTTARLVVPGSHFESESRILGAMLFGEYDLLLPEQLEDFRITGTLHIFAISGMHVAILAIVIFGIFSRLRIPFFANALVTLAVLWLYISIAGLAASSVRAWLMIALLFAAQAFKRSSSSLPALVLAGTAALWVEPFLLTNLGFQLSYGVVAAILLYGSPLEEFILSRWVLFKFIPEKNLSLPRQTLIYLQKKSVGLAAISFAAFIAGTCFLATHFEMVTPFAILVNIILVPFCGIMLCLAFFAALISRVSFLGDIADFIWMIDCRITSIVEIISALCADVPATFEIRFISEFAGTIGGVLILLLFVSGVFKPLRSRPLLRFAIPPIFLLAYLLAFTG